MKPFPFGLRCETCFLFNISSLTWSSRRIHQEFYDLHQMSVAAFISSLQYEKLCVSLDLLMSRIANYPMRPSNVPANDMYEHQKPRPKNRTWTSHSNSAPLRAYLDNRMTLNCYHSTAVRNLFCIYWFCRTPRFECDTWESLTANSRHTCVMHSS